MTLTDFTAGVAPLRRHPRLTAALAALLIMVALAIFAPWISPQNPYDLAQVSILDSKLPPGSVGMDGFKMLLGADDQGRDMLSAIFYGLRASLLVGFLSTAGAVIIGSFLGIMAALSKGVIDAAISRLIELQLSFPAMLVALMLVATIGQGVDKVILALILVQWAYYARTIRAAAQVEVEREYIEAARCLALPNWRVMFAHILPNCLPVVVVVATIQMAHAIVLEATLSFLGLGLPLATPSLGRLIANGFDYVLSGTYWISLFPGIALLIVVYCINVIGDEFRRILNPRSL